MRLNCKCGYADVTVTDHAEKQGEMLVVHGKDFCYQTEKYNVNRSVNTK